MMITCRIRQMHIHQRFSGEAAGDAIIKRLDAALWNMAKRSKADAIRVSSVTGRSEPAEDPAP